MNATVATGNNGYAYKVVNLFTPGPLNPADQTTYGNLTSKIDAVKGSNSLGWNVFSLAIPSAEKPNFKEATYKTLGIYTELDLISTEKDFLLQIDGYINLTSSRINYQEGRNFWVTPYEDSTTGANVTTVSRVLVIRGIIVGVIAVDLSIDYLKTLQEGDFNATLI